MPIEATLTPSISTTKLRDTSITIQELITTNTGERVMISSSSNNLRKYKPYTRLSLDNKRLKPYWDGMIINPNNQYFQFRLYQGDFPVVVLEYEYVNGLIITRRANGRPAEVLHFTR